MPEQKTEKKERNLNLRGRLFEIQKSIKTLCAQEPSAKKNDKGESEYRYTPGWAVVEALRVYMDKYEVMLDKEFINPVSTLIQNGPVIENLVTVTGRFTWVDVHSGETAGPYEFTMQSANGIDKSMATAISNCERYFLLKYFGITTREKDVEADAHHVNNVISRQAVPASAPAPQMQYAPQAPQYPQMQPQAATLFPSQQVPTAPARQQTRMQGPQTLSPDQVYESAITALSYFPEGTQTHADTLKRWQDNLAAVGFQAYDPGFTQGLVAAATARRNSR